MFSLKIPSVNVTKSAGVCGFGYIYWRNLYFVHSEILMPWKFEKEYVRAKYQTADQRI